MPQFGGFHSLTVGDLGLMTLATEDGGDNKNQNQNTMISLSDSLLDGKVVKCRVVEPTQAENSENCLFFFLW